MPAAAAPPRTRPRIVGHRGAALLAPENTLASFRRALADGAQLLECDVHLSRDGHVVILHDETVDRTAEAGSPRRSGAVAELTRAELDEVQVGGGERVPALEDLLALTTVPVFIEVKAAAAARAVAGMLAQLPEGSPAKSSTVITFHADAIAPFRELSPATPVSYLVGTVDEAAVRTAAELGAVGIGPWIGGLSLAAATAVREAGLALNPWTINEPAQLEVALACGADTITTDDPAWVARELDARGL